MNRRDFAAAEEEARKRAPLWIPRETEDDGEDALSPDQRVDVDLLGSSSSSRPMRQSTYRTRLQRVEEKLDRVLELLEVSDDGN